MIIRIKYIETFIPNIRHENLLICTKMDNDYFQKESIFHLMQMAKEINSIQKLKKVTHHFLDPTRLLDNIIEEETFQCPTRISEKQIHNDEHYYRVEI